jgi:hypothetical protein
LKYFDEYKCRTYSKDKLDEEKDEWAEYMFTNVIPRGSWIRYETNITKLFSWNCLYVVCCFRFFSWELFVYDMSFITKELHDISGIILPACVDQPHGLQLEVKTCGYHLLYMEDLEQLTPQMMYSGNSLVQNMYLTSD